ncbi:MAG: glycosyl hydrolase 108 family protein [Acetobacteraceae bacterium]
MTASNFAAALDFIWGPTRDGHQDDSAPGETFRTSWGMKQMTWDAAVADGIVAGDLAHATKDQCAAIYRARYWNALHCSSLPDGVDLMAFNDATLCGPGHAARLMQRIVGAQQDGAVGPETLRKVGSFGVRALIDRIAAGDLEYFMTLHNAPPTI